MVDVLEFLEAENSMEDQTRAFKWLLVIHDLLFRLPPRGGRRGRSYVSNRFAAWRDGDYAKVLSWWMHDRQAVRHPLHQKRHESKQGKLALHLINVEELSKAVIFLSGNGLDDLSDARVVEQLQCKHPTRKKDFQAV